MQDLKLMGSSGFFWNYAFIRGWELQDWGFLWVAQGAGFMAVMGSSGLRVCCFHK